MMKREIQMGSGAGNSEDSARDYSVGKRFAGSNGSGAAPSPIISTLLSKRVPDT
jgi:hypothetical protein